MGLAADLGYVFPRPNPFQRAVQAFGSTRAGAWFFSKTLRHMDRALHKLSGGRTSVPRLLAGLPVVMVTTTGRRSGRPRTTALLAPPVGDTIALLGTNFGSATTPAWAHNLEADPRATVLYAHAERSVIARAATDDERNEIWRTAAAVSGAYAKYQERLTGRTARLFVL